MKTYTPKTVIRFWSKVSKKGHGGCWLWMGYVNPKTGYGCFGTETRKNGTGSITVLAHRFAFVVSGGKFENGTDVLHKCIGQRDCVNPDHLYAGTKQDNANDKVTQGRQTKGEDVPQCKVPNSRIGDVFALYEEGKSQKEIAAILGVVQQTVSRILNKRTAAHFSSQFTYVKAYRKSGVAVSQI